MTKYLDGILGLASVASEHVSSALAMLKKGLRPSALLLLFTQASMLASQTLNGEPITVFEFSSDERVASPWGRSEVDDISRRWAPSTANATSPPNIGDDSYYWYKGERIPLEIVPGGLFVMDLADPMSDSLSQAEQFEVRTVAGAGYRYLGGGYGMHWLSARPPDDLWGVENASGAPPVDHVKIFSDARQVIGRLSAWSESTRAGRYLFSPFYRPFEWLDLDTRLCVFMNGSPFSVGFESGVSLSRAEQILAEEIGGWTLSTTDFSSSGVRSHQVATADFTDGMALLKASNHLETLPEVRWSASFFGSLGCGGPSGGPGGGGAPPSTAPVSAPSLGTLGLSALALVLALLGVSTIRRSL